MQSLGFLLLDQHVVDGRADHIAWAGEPPLTYARLLERVAALAGGLRGLGVRAGDDVAVVLDPGLDRAVVVCACIRLGAFPREHGTIRIVSRAEGPVVEVVDDAIDLVSVGKAGATDPAGALRTDAEGYVESVTAAHAELVRTLRSGGSLHP
ncbi:AMP-binding protein [Aeromicrobium sp. CTD01-1L150]|uniref:AMP-binding protein n=1 Tax=Aeromicrobium sp. CTD01-1L150 TaxID=3341830 RepID=UPI0035C0079F